MKGLTPEEFAALSDIAAERRYEIEDGTPPHAVRVDLAEQGRVVLGAPLNPERAYGSWFLTAAGREAVRLWPLVRQFMETRSGCAEGAPR